MCYCGIRLGIRVSEIWTLALPGNLWPWVTLTAKSQSKCAFDEKWHSLNDLKILQFSLKYFWYYDWKDKLWSFIIFLSLESRFFWQETIFLSFPLKGEKTFFSLDHSKIISAAWCMGYRQVPQQKKTLMRMEVSTFLLKVF